MSKEPPQYASIKDAARRYKISCSTLYREVRTGAIPALRLGGVWRIDCNRLEQKLSNQKRE